MHNILENMFLCFLQLILVPISVTTGFGATLNDSVHLAELSTELDNLFSVQLFVGDVQQTDSSSESSTPDVDQVPILVVNALPDSAADSVTV